MAKPRTSPAAETPAAPAVDTSRKSASTVTVACNFPAGLELQLCKETSWPEETPSGTRQRTRFDKVGQVVIVRGPAHPVGTAPRGYVQPQIVGGYALTPNVPADFFREWMKQNAESPFVKNKVIFAHESRDHAIGTARDNKGNRSGFEPLVPPDQDASGKVTNLDPRMPRPAGAGLSVLSTADEMADRQPLPAGADAE